MSQLLTDRAPVQDGVEKLPVIDTDVHQNVFPTDAVLRERLPERWANYLSVYGERDTGTELGIPPQRKMTHRIDAVDANGRTGADPKFVRGQLLDAFDMSGVVLSNPTAIKLSRGGNNFPEPLAIALAGAFNDAHHDVWLNADPRYYAAINISLEHPVAAVQEIERCRALPHGDRFVSVVVEARAEYPIGNPKYWPILEVLAQYGLPLQFHVAPGRRMTGCGPVNYYYEWHVGMPLRNYTIASSLIFEGAFDQFPNLKIALIEQGWGWAAPFAWRMDSAWKMLRDEVPHLQKAPSDYLRDHFWFATQPMEEPENLEDVRDAYDQFVSAVGPGRLMFSSDYPHWDFDSPYESVPATVFSLEERRQILGDTASELFGIPLLAGHGIAASGIAPKVAAR